MRWLLRPPRVPLHLLARLGPFRIPLLLLLLAAVAEVYLHGRPFAVRQPAHDTDPPFRTGCAEPAADAPRESAALVMLARNADLAGALRSIASVERHFNKWFHYPFVFLNDEPWDDEFVRAASAAVSGAARFEVVAKEDWSFPPWVDVQDARASIADQGRRGLMYGGKESYHHMCRFFSGKFYTIPALQQYKWYWRVEPDVDFYCDMTYDPFVEMAKRGKVYGFTIALAEESNTCPTLFRRVSDWKEEHGLPTTELWKAMMEPSWVPWPFRSMMSWFRHRDRFGDGWSLCHYWSNFEIASLDFFRDRDYQSLFESLDKAGGFYYERWGDAPVHSLALSLLLEPDKVHHFDDFGYRHGGYYHCPANAPGGQLLDSKLLGEPTDAMAPEREGGVGCRCECNRWRTRNHKTFCFHKLKQPTTARRLNALQWVVSRFLPGIV